MKTKLLLVIPSLIFAINAHADSATWNLDPPSGIWNMATNWTPASVPNGPSDVATFELSSETNVSFSAVTEIDGIVFNPGANAFTITNGTFHEVTISGAGIINNSGRAQSFIGDMGSGAPVHKGPLSPAFPEWTFANSATAGSNTFFAIIGGYSELGVGGNVVFYDTSTADHATFDVDGSSGYAYSTELGFYGSSTAANATIHIHRNGNLTVSGSSGPTLGNAVVTNEEGFITISVGGSAGQATITNIGHRQFGQVGMSLYANSATPVATAAEATITNEGGSATLEPGAASFGSYSTAANAVIMNNGGDGQRKNGGYVYFGGISSTGATAENATLIANTGSNGGRGGSIIFASTADGGMARAEIFGNGSLDISQRDGPGITIGSIEGDGLIFLGADNLATGSNNLTATFSGLIQDGGIQPDTGGSLTKIGTGTLTLSGRNTYTGGTTVSGGALLVSNGGGSATGTGAVAVNAETLGGSGTITGAVTVGTGSGGGAYLAPAFASTKQVILTIQSSLTLQVDATYTYTFKAKNNRSRSDLIVANGVTINGATISISGTTQNPLTTGTVLTLVSNTSADPIAGTFSNLADGAIVTVNGNDFQADYQGGDGNDLTLTVVP
jgi:autotransporter-associated beta strand protein